MDWWILTMMTTLGKSAERRLRPEVPCACLQRDFES